MSRSTLKPEGKEYPSFTPDDIGLLFSDIATPVGLILNHNDPRECFVIFSDPEYVPEILKLIDTPQWMGTHMNVTLDKPWGENNPYYCQASREQSFRRWGRIWIVSPWKQMGLHNFLPQRRERNLQFLNWQKILRLLRLLSWSTLWQPYLRKWRKDKWLIKVPLSLMLQGISPRMYPPYCTV